MQNLKYSGESKSLNRILLLLANLIVASIVFYFMGAKHTNIGFHADDYGFTYNGRYNSLHDIKAIFSNSDMITCAGTMLDKETVEKKNFLETLYRPLVLLIMGTEYKFFGMNAYYFHLVHTTLHTITTLTILNVVTMYSGPLCAIPLSLFWGLHTNLKDYFFWQCYVQNSLETGLLCIMVLFFLLWYRRRWIPTLIGFLVLFFITLLLRETLIVLPVLVGLFVFFEERNLKQVFKSTVLFLIPIAAYMGLRLWAHPFSTSVQCIGIKNFTQNNHSLLQTINLKFFDWVAWFMDMIGLHWLPKGYTLIKLSALVALGIFVVSTWRQNAYKNYLAVLTCGLILLSWPSLLLCHCSRYLYLPTLCFALLIGFLSSNLTQRSKYLFFAVFILYATVQGVVTNQRMQVWVARTHLEQEQIADGIGSPLGVSLYRKLSQ